MIRIITLVVAGFSILPSSVFATGTSSLNQMFAACAGRLSAQLEHEWLMYDASADDTARLLAQFQELVEATTATNERVATLDLRIHAKMAQHAVLTRGTFNGDSADAVWARNRAETEIAQCRSLLLNG